MTPKRIDGLIKLQDKALAAAKELRIVHGRESDVAWKTLTDALLDARGLLMKERDGAAAPEPE